MKKCPFCAGEIQDEVIKCKHCGEFLDSKKTIKNEQITKNIHCGSSRVPIIVGIILLVLGLMTLPTINLHRINIFNTSCLIIFGVGILCVQNWARIGVFLYQGLMNIYYFMNWWTDVESNQKARDLGELAGGITLFAILLVVLNLKHVKEQFTKKAKKEKANSATEKAEEEKIDMEMKQRAREEQQLVVSRVGKDSKAEQIGIMKGDIIKRVCGKDVKTIVKMMDALESRNKTQPVKIELLRCEDAIITMEVKMGDNENRLGVFF